MARLPWTRLRRQSNSDGLSFGLGAEGLSLEASLLCVRACSERMHDPVPKPDSGSSRSSKATSTTTRYQETSRVWACSAIGCLLSGGAPFADGARKPDQPDAPPLYWLSDGFPNRERSIPFLMLASPPLIRDKNRMR